MMEGSSVSVEEGNVGSRKKQRKESLRKLKQKERLVQRSFLSVFFFLYTVVVCLFSRHSKPDVNTIILHPCRHNDSAYKCDTLKRHHIERLLECIYKNENKSYQDQWISRYIAVDNVKRERPRTDSKGQKKPHSLSITYFVSILLLSLST